MKKLSLKIIVIGLVVVTMSSCYKLGEGYYRIVDKYIDYQKSAGASYNGCGTYPYYYTKAYYCFVLDNGTRYGYRYRVNKEEFMRYKVGDFYYVCR